MLIAGPIVEIEPDRLPVSVEMNCLSRQGSPGFQLGNALAKRLPYQNGGFVWLKVQDVCKPPNSFFIALGLS